MFFLDSSSLPSVTPSFPGFGAQVGIVQDSAYLGLSGFPLVEIDYSANPAIPAIPQSATVTAVIPAPISPGITVIPNVNVSQVGSAEFNGITFLPAVDANDPKAGEFVYNSSTRSLALYSDANYPAPEGLTIQIRGVDRSPIVNKKFVPNIPSWLRLLPLQGEISWSLAVEQHPSGSFKLITNQSGISQLRNMFKVGNRFSMFGIGFQVSNYSEAQSLLSQVPGGKYEVQVNLSGWLEEIIDQPVDYLGRNFNTGTPSGSNLDPDCQVTATSGSANTGLPTSTYTTVAKLCQQIGIQYQGLEMRVDIPNDLTNASTTTIGTEFTARLRHLGLYADYTQAYALRAEPLTNAASFAITDDILLDKPALSYQGKTSTIVEVPLTGSFNQVDLNSTLPSALAAAPVVTVLPEDPVLIPNTCIFPNVKLDGKFTEPAGADLTEDNRSNQTAIPFWKYIPPIIRKTKRGDLDALSPPEGAVPITSPSMNASSSGVTKTEEEVTTIDGIETERITRVWGYAFLAKNHTTQETVGGRTTKKMIVLPQAAWTQVRETRVETVFDGSTGYILGTNTYGWELRRFQEESDSLETIQIEASLARPGLADQQRALLQRRMATYQFEQTPITGAQRKLLRRFAPYYADTPKPPVEYVKRCNPDGTSSMVAVRDPNYVSPMFASIETQQESSYSEMPSPESPKRVTISGSTVFVQPPPLAKGRETFTHKEVVIKPSSANRSVFSTLIPDPDNQVMNVSISSNTQETQDQYTLFSSDFSAEGARFSQFAQKTQFEEFYGRPSEAQRLAKRYEKVQPESPTVRGRDAGRSMIDYRLTTPGFNPYGLESGSTVSYPHAQTLEQAMVGVRTDAKIKDVTSAPRTLSVKIPFHPELRPMWIIPAVVNGIQYANRINQATCTLKIVGTDENGQLYCEGETSLSLSPERNVAGGITVTAIPKQESSGGSTGDGTTGNTTLPPLPGGTAIIDAGQFALGAVLPNSVPRRR